MSTSNSGLLIVGIGIAIIVIGLLVWSGGLSWFGRLPGDVRIDRGSFHFYFPIASMVLVSIVLSLLVKLLSRPR
jgi:hypothetical protein